MAFDVAAVRSHFPSLASGIAHFDGPGGSQTPAPVARAVHDTLLSGVSNRSPLTSTGRLADQIVHEARAAMGDLLAADPRGIVFGRSMTALTFEFARALAAGWGPGDEVAVSRLDHDANVRPWVIAAGRAGATVRWIDFDPATGELTADDVAAAVSDRTRLVALTGASNLLGTRPDLAAAATVAHGVGALFFVDAVHLAAHAVIDTAQIGADVVACSPYKFYGPHCGVLAVRPDLLEALHPDKLVPSTDAIPERFELGTLPYELLAGTSAAVEFVAGLTASTGTRRRRIVESGAAAERYETSLRERLEAELATLPGVVLHSRAAQRTPTLLLTFNGRDAGDAAAWLAERDVNAPAGSFYAHEPATRLGLPDGGLRIGLAPYTDDRDVERLLAGLRAFIG
ncbi:cysteine desulfurase-like protein [Jatrophihabitans endophyticus]|uniref:cysteine desulfurase-like protein n=1 Tax=Jatrophihabitans endophyticus TaxID=1206085 RepID=UPI0019EFEE9F|nr:cysteine desulfurase-like protein [Jatrophihabitans endophyticus]MBE7187434.1 cysteine desulfurase-like protein [Jatrophihabitans endophyticus]